MHLGADPGETRTNRRTPVRDTADPEATGAPEEKYNSLPVLPR